MTAQQQNLAEQNKAQRTIMGKVVSNKMNKTIVVEVERMVKHPLYEKYVRKFSKMYAHDESNDCHIGDTVLIMQSRPLSKLKTWKLVNIVKRQGQE